MCNRPRGLSSEVKAMMFAIMQTDKSGKKFLASDSEWEDSFMSDRITLFRSIPEAEEWFAFNSRCCLPDWPRRNEVSIVKIQTLHIDDADYATLTGGKVQP